MFDFRGLHIYRWCFYDGPGGRKYDYWVRLRVNNRCPGLRWQFGMSKWRIPSKTTELILAWEQMYHVSSYYHNPLAHCVPRQNTQSSGLDPNFIPINIDAFFFFSKTFYLNTSTNVCLGTFYCTQLTLEFTSLIYPTQLYRTLIVMCPFLLFVFWFSIFNLFIWWFGVCLNTHQTTQ